MDWNSDIESRGAAELARFPDWAEVTRHVEQARGLRSQATATLLGTALRAVARPLRALIGGAVRWRQHRATGAALMRCSDRVLADIGFAREDIPLIARGLDPKQQPERPAAGRWPAMLGQVRVPGRVGRDASDEWTRHHPQALADRA